MKKLVRPVRRVNAEVVGLDVHQNLIVFTRLDRRGEEVTQGSLPATEEALRSLFVSCRRRVHVAFEAGGSTFRVYDLLVELLGAGCVHVAQPKRIRAIATSTEKNDFNDSWWLAYLTYEGRLPECYVPTGNLRELRIAVRERFELVKLITRAKTRLRGHLRQLGVKLPVRKIDSITGWNILVDLAETRKGVQAEAVERVSFGRQLSPTNRWRRKPRALASRPLPQAANLMGKLPSEIDSMGHRARRDDWPGADSLSRIRTEAGKSKTKDKLGLDGATRLETVRYPVPRAGTCVQRVDPQEIHRTPGLPGVAPDAHAWSRNQPPSGRR